MFHFIKKNKLLSALVISSVVFTLYVLKLYSETFTHYPSSKSSDWSDFGTLISGLFSVVTSTVTLAILFINIKEFHKVEENNKKMLSKASSQLSLAAIDSKRQEHLFVTGMRREQLADLNSALSDFEELYKVLKLKFNRPYLKMKIFGYLGVQCKELEEYKIDDTIIREAQKRLVELSEMARKDEKFESFDFSSCEVKYSSILELLGMTINIGKSENTTEFDRVNDSNMILGGTYSSSRNSIVIYQPNIYMWHHMISHIVNSLIKMFGVDIKEVDPTTFHYSKEFYYQYTQYIRALESSEMKSLYSYSKKSSAFNTLFDIIYDKDDFYLIHHYSDESRELIEDFESYMIKQTCEFNHNAKSLIGDAMNVFSNIDRDVYNRLYNEYSKLN